MWIAINPDKLALSPDERKAVADAAAEAGEDSPAVAMAARLARRIRARCKAAGITLDAEAGTIPDELEAAALAILRYDVLTYFPSVAAVLLDDKRVEAWKDGNKDLADLSKGLMAVEAPEDASDETAETGSAGGRAKITGRAKKSGRSNAEGL